MDEDGGGGINLLASLVVRNEADRYLDLCLDHLLEFCDGVVVLDDASDDDTAALLHSRDDRVHVIRQPRPTFYIHEGHTRQTLIDATRALNPTHVLSIDADELVTDGHKLRARLEAEPKIPVWSLTVEEVWKADGDVLSIREDGGWRSHEISACWKVPQPGVRYTMLDRKLACRRVPSQVLRIGARRTHVSLLHLGWLDEAARRARYQRYADHDQGRFHAKRHLDSILWPDENVQLRQRPWPEGRVGALLRARL